MDELKSCLFCGRYIDKTFRYCPHCGYEFTAEEDPSEPGEDPGRVPEEGEGNDEESQAVPGTSDFYFLRLQDIQKLLADMEKELDLMLTEGGLNPGRASAGALTTSSRDP
jgi:hypothetical protein